MWSLKININSLIITAQNLLTKIHKQIVYLVFVIVRIYLRKRSPKVRKVFQNIINQKYTTMYKHFVIN